MLERMGVFLGIATIIMLVVGAAGWTISGDLLIVAILAAVAGILVSIIGAARDARREL